MRNPNHTPALASRTQNQVACLLILSSIFVALTARSQQSVQAWVQRYGGGLPGSDDRANKVVTDGAGNVIVVGSTDEGATGRDMLVIKYSSTGVALWTNRYNGPANYDDVAQSVTVDSSGRVFVTGFSYGSQNLAEYATI